MENKYVAVAIDKDGRIIRELTAPTKGDATWNAFILYGDHAEHVIEVRPLGPVEPGKPTAWRYGGPGPEGGLRVARRKPLPSTGTLF